MSSEAVGEETRAITITVGDDIVRLSDYGTGFEPEEELNKTGEQSSPGSKKIVGVFCKPKHDFKNDNLVGCVQGALGMQDWLESKGHQYIIAEDKGPNCAERIKKAKNLQLVLTAGIGIDHIDLKAAAATGLTVAEVTGSNVVSVAEEAIFLAEDALMRILVLVNNFSTGYNQIISGEWNVFGIASRAHSLEGKTVGTVGGGHIAGLLFQRLKPFHCDLLYHDQSKMDPELENQTGARFEEDLDSMLPKCDIIVINTPLVEKTEMMFDKKRIKNVKKGVLIVNNSSGAIMDMETLAADCLSRKVIAGYSGNPWQYMPNQAMTSHICGSTIDEQVRYAAGVKDMLEMYLKGEDFPPQNYILKDGELASQEMLDRYKGEDTLSDSAEQ
ncbi:formate dehydrogenase, mitochondrial-like isoform X2 [Cornus florida]|uniref:formate dehydrogenase, mitochondrial-like isoform X2 n=1 Tax=Cornus florida TaxID=4283 RepID=UPI00289F78C4|nr:formate dehydrogenase, mitochondrial-like isoform X2 [Cornus florida]